MSQEYTDDKDTTLKKLNSDRRLLKAMLFLIGIFSFYLIMVLISFSPVDPSWSQTSWHGQIHNLGGDISSCFAYTLFFTFGILAYAQPPIMLFFCWSVFIQRNRREYLDLFGLSLRLIGSIALLLSSCGLAALNVNDLYYFASGGVIGSLLSNVLLAWFNITGATLMLLFVWAFGLTLFTGLSWLIIAEKIGAVVLGSLTFISNCSRRDNKENNSNCRSRVIPDNEYDAHLHVNDNDDPLLPPCKTRQAKSNPLLRPSAPVASCLSKAARGSYMSSTTDVRLDYPAQRSWTERVLSSTMPPQQAEKMSHYNFKLPADTSDNLHTLAAEENESGMSDCQLDLDASNIPYDFTVSQQKKSELSAGRAADARQRSTPMTFMPAFSASGNDYNLQLKKGIGPELPRPNPVRIPTRRELASCGIKIPFQQRSTLEEQQESIQDELTPTTGIDRCHKAGFAAQDALVTSSTYDDVAPSQEDNLFKSAAQTPIMESPIYPFFIRKEQSLKKSSTPLPTIDLLTPPPHEKELVDMLVLEQTARLVEARLADYRVKAKVVGISPGPVITHFELDLGPGVKAARISNLSRDLARSLSTIAVRVVELIPGKPYIGLELPNKRRETVYLREVLDCKKFRDSPSPLVLVLGKDISGQPMIADLGKMPHLLVGGTTGSGKSVGINAMILSILYKATPKEVRFIMIDPKMLELSIYEGIPHLLTKIVTNMKEAANALRWCVGEMERRYKLMAALGVRNMNGYNEKIKEANTMGRPVPNFFCETGNDRTIETPLMLGQLPYIVVMVDEFADLMMAVDKKVEKLIAHLVYKARAAGIHLVLATQQPSVDVITGFIKTNIPTRIAFTVSSKIDSRTILDQTGAESLLGMGDMLYLASNSSLPVRVHGAFVHYEDVHAVVKDWKARGQPQYINSITIPSHDDEGNGLDGDE